MAQDMDAPLEKGRAASDDARDFPSAAAASSAAAGKERDACAEVAPPLEGKRKLRPKSSVKQAGKGTPRGPSEQHASEKTASRKKKNEKDEVDIPPGSEILAEDGIGFVDAIHEHVDLYLACARLVKSTDEKIAQRMVERLLEMSYGKSPAPPEDQPPHIIFDAPRPLRD